MPGSTRTIWKVTHAVADSIQLEIPQGSTLLAVDDQRGEGGTLDFWFFTDPAETAKETREIRVHGTGHPIDEDVLVGWRHLGTVVTAGGALVWHVFLEGDK